MSLLFSFLGSRILAYGIALFAVIVAYGLATRKREETGRNANVLSIAAHEIRTPLTAIRWSIENLMSENAADMSQETRKAIGVVYDNSLTLIARVNNVANLAMIERGITVTKEPVALRAFLLESTKGLMPLASARNISLVFDPSLSHTLTLELDPRYAQIAFYNLIAYMIGHTRAHADVRVSYELIDGMHRLTIADTGDGLTEEELGTIFAAYDHEARSRRSSREGSRLGMYLSKKIFELHGGNIVVHSELGKGTACVVTLPAQ